jgi:hypothetical protein
MSQKKNGKKEYSQQYFRIDTAPEKAVYMGGYP